MFKLLAGGLLVIAVIAACSGTEDQPGVCMTMSAPGTLIAVPGIDLQVRDQYGQGQAFGTTALVRRSDTGEVLNVAINDTLHIYSAWDLTGDFTVSLTRPYYQDVTISKVTVTPNGCLVNTTKVPVTLQLVPGAPALRAVAVAGAQYIAAPHQQVQLLAHFDADPGVSRAATWQVNDTTLATIDANGLVTAKCPNPGGTLKVTVTSVATPTVSADASMSVAPYTANYCQ
jgi:hypothetical protein